MLNTMKTLTPIFVVALAFGCSGPSVTPEPVETAEPTQPSIEREELGDLVIVERQTDAAFVTFRIVFDAGSAEDLAGQEGVTALAADLMVEGGAGQWTYAQITEALFPMAASVSAQTSREQTVFSGRVHVDHLDAFYAVFRSVLLEPMLGAADFERIRSRALDGIQLQLRGNDDEELGKETLQAMLYEAHPYGHPEVGTVSALEALTLDDVIAQRLRVFCGARATIGLTGGYPDSLVQQVVDDVRSLDQSECVGRRILDVAQSTEPRVWIVEKESASAVAVSMGVPIDLVRGDDDYAALVLAVAYFGQHRTFAGRLMGEMRGERGLNYGDYAYMEHFDQDGWSAMPRPNIARSQQYFSIWIRPVSVENAHFATRMAVRELREFVANGLSEEDFERSVAYVMGYYPLFLQTESRQLGYAIDDSFYGEDEQWIQMLLADWAGLTREQVNAAIARYIDPSNLQIAVVHPDGEAFADLLASEAASPIEYAAEISEEVLSEDESIVPYVIGIPREQMMVVPLDAMFE